MERERVQELKTERQRLHTMLEQQSRLLESPAARKRGFWDFFTG
jgi:hypothetical protein